MCGIAGVAGPLRKDEALNMVHRMNEAMVHRGPDDEGLWARDGFGFGMRRLSIIDLRDGQQPVWTGEDEGEIGVVYNGEIYNYQALREDLARAGEPLRTKCDTEVIPYLYRREGIDSIAKLEGMFAFCLYDGRLNKFFLVRDRLGIKPLYYARAGGLFLFASEIKAILAALETRPEINEQALHHYLTLRYVPGPDTIWDGVHKLPPGHILSFDFASGAFQTRRYWHVSFRAESAQPERDYPAEFECLFLSAVEKRLVAADVPVGVLLSGGLDSSAVSAAAVELGHRNFHTFSVAFDEGGEFDETAFAREAAADAGAQHHEVTVNQEKFVDFLPDLVGYTDEPLADLASVPLFFVARLARENVKVVLSGEGADEVLCGYDMERLAVDLERLRKVDRLVPRPILRLLGRLLSGRAGTIAQELAQNGWSNLLRTRGAHMTRHWSEEEKAALRPGHSGRSSTTALIHEWYGETTSPHPLDQLQDVYCGSWLVEDLLMKADKMTMAASLELRVPFLDHALVEWAASLPHEWKVGDARSGPISKRILRDFAVRRLPGSIVERPKQGFPVPAYAWLATSLGPWAEDMLFGPGNRLAEHFDPAAARPALEAARAGDTASSHKIWVLLIFEHWLRRWT
ncbi:MAG: asparagine synthase (glutamine-hydrolyzing) [Proteobacteria bacterium]|nr:asparagine synthase (glutamine-hydrolyzing) [Pseudomonadota bacterium]